MPFASCFICSTIIRLICATEIKFHEIILILPKYSDLFSSLPFHSLLFHLIPLKSAGHKPLNRFNDSQLEKHSSRPLKLCIATENSTLGSGVPTSPQQGCSRSAPSAVRLGCGRLSWTVVLDAAGHLALSLASACRTWEHPRAPPAVMTWKADRRVRAAA